MSQEKSEAVVLRGVAFSETSRIVTFLTPGRGRMACLAKGVRRKNSRWGGLLDSFNRVELVYYWKDGRQVQTLGDVSLLDDFSGLKRDLSRNVYAAFPLEVAGKTAHENEPSEALFEALVRGLAGLAAWPGDARVHVCWQLMRLLEAAGFAPGLDQCVSCGGALCARPGFAYDGGAVCGACRADRRIAPETLASLRVLQDAADRCPEIPAGAEIFAVLRRYAAQQLETDFRSVRVIEEMFG